MAEKITSLRQALWNSADQLRGQMDANDYKNYLLGLIFYKHLSDKLLLAVCDNLEEHFNTFTDTQKIFEDAYQDEDLKDDLISVVTGDLGYFIEPTLTFEKLIRDVYHNTFQLESLAQGFRDIEQSGEDFENLFEDIDLYSKKLGSTPQKQNQTIANVMKTLNEIDFESVDGDTLGDAYEYLIGEFASESGKKAGEFYTPQAVSHLMTQIVFSGREDQKGMTLYDPAMGSGSLLLNAKKYSHQSDTVSYYGQEINTSTYNLARMNMMLHGVAIENQHLSNADTLDADWPTDEPTNFDGVLMNPPYSLKWSATAGFLTDPRFSSYGVLAPKSKADFAFLLHGFYHLKNTGTMAIVLPHGVLFRGSAEGKIRQKLLEQGAIDTIIGLPSNIFYNTSIPTTIIILKKNRTNKDVFFIDASKEFEKGKNQNTMTDDHIKKILDAYKSRDNSDKFSYLASFDEIIENDYNLNIPRYVDTFEEVPVKPLPELAKQLSDIDQEIAKTNAKLDQLMKRLVGTTKEAQDELDAFRK
ncbi:type I restriction-modification system subunit M [Streptococcus agalactiae]|uniref:type I restriction-modification system subunit M n=1 Tax=Streptococcus agalactiae TaxID=1311 RepID=UPI0002BB4475|nr:type I restriction-modification system subunit M [Streptococcus agalactiae]EPU21707.1 restriction endonuclease subunit M [Streptococcus agalactiae LMG 14609]EPU23699.1 restriction endonuclease subunit M [Streptococcus agalactiae LMG 14838]EPU99112.1 restriction endonuclease subunit M [Streptococcus agalactiae GB00279]EPV32206.1 restriction endonuclease subunit M [Streptococcus agalactiae GB00679]EPX05796.1 restriction endonuclease subunit M [Streptococcus agalactiae MRI Z1-215]